MKFFHEAWSNIKIETLQKLIESMPKRCKEVINRKGYPTHY